MLVRVAVVVALAGCGVDPTDPPPDAASFPFDANKLSAEIDGGLMRIIGAEGAVVDTTEIFGVSLSDPKELVAAQIGANGAFEIAIPGEDRQRYRLEAVTSTGRTAVDFGIGLPGIIYFGACTSTLSATTVYDFGSVPVGESRAITLELQNNCPEPLLRLGSRDLANTAAFALDLSAIQIFDQGKSTAATLTFTPATTGDLIDHISIDVRNYPAFVVTVRGHGY